MKQDEEGDGVKPEGGEKDEKLSIIKSEGAAGYGDREAAGIKAERSSEDDRPIKRRKTEETEVRWCEDQR